ncbi:hypothetical protein X975_16242, partial [Stegodyphus mimosarum]
MYPIAAFATSFIFQNCCDFEFWSVMKLFIDTITLFVLLNIFCI